MYTLLRSIPKRQMLLEQAPIIASSLAIAELFYKLHSFILECTAFMATWFVIDAVVRMAVGGRSRVRGARATGPELDVNEHRRAVEQHEAETLGGAPSPHCGA
jgi:hypothetical protein